MTAMKPWLHRSIDAAPSRWAPLMGPRSRTQRQLHAVATEDAQVADGFLPAFGKEMMDCDIVNGNYNDEYCTSVYDHTVETPEGYWVDKIEGEIPKELEGTYFRNGPGDFNFLNEPVAYPHDANGIIGSVAIKDGRAFFRSRYVETKESLMEERAGRRLFKGPFGTVPKNGVAPFRLLTNRNAANGKTFLANGKLYAPFEMAPLTEVDPFTLETLYPKLSDNPVSWVLDTALHLFPYIGDFQLGFESDSPYLNPRTVRGFGDSKYDGRRNVTICHSYKPISKIGSNSLSTEMRFFEFGEDFKLRHRHQSYIMDGFSMQHSIGVSENYYIVNKFPTEIDFAKALDPNQCIVTCIEWDQSGAHEFHFVPRPSCNSENGIRRKPLVFKMNETTYMNHFVNAFEDGDKIIIDALHYETYPRPLENVNGNGNFRDWKPTLVVPPRFRRTICSLNGEVETQEISTRSVELPNINPNFLGRPYQFVYLVTALHPFKNCNIQAIGKVNLDTGEMDVWTKGDHYYAGEPLFVPRPGSTTEDDGWVMGFCYNGETKRTEFVILDAQNIKQGPIAVLYLDQAIGHGFHGQWTNRFFGPRL